MSDLKTLASSLSVIAKKICDIAEEDNTDFFDELKEAKEAMENACSQVEASESSISSLESNIECISDDMSSASSDLNEANTACEEAAQTINVLYNKLKAKKKKPEEDKDE